MKQVTRNIDLASARDLLERVPRACLCFASQQGPQAQPITLLWREGRYLAGIPRSASQPDPGQEVVLLVDEGIYYFDLRAVYIRGQAQPTKAPKEAPAGCTWHEVIPLKTVAWDYGMLRAATDES